MKARSEWVTPLKRPAGGVFDRSFTFHAASAAFVRMIRRDWPSMTVESVVPGASPTRGSGLGADVLMFAGDGLLPDDIDDEEQAASTDATASDAAARVAD